MVLGGLGQVVANERVDQLVDEVLEVGISHIIGLENRIFICDTVVPDWQPEGSSISLFKAVKDALSSGLNGEEILENHGLITLTALGVQKSRDEQYKDEFYRSNVLSARESVVNLFRTTLRETEDKESLIYSYCVVEIKKVYEDFEKKIHENIKL